MTDKMRSDFEVEILKNKAAFQIRRVASGEYQSGTTQELWEYWQAATLAERELHSYYTTGVHGLVDKSKSHAIRQGGEG